MNYLIINNEDGDDAGLFWSNEDGWGSEETATIFSEEERQTFRLPMGGKWYRVED